MSIDDSGDIDAVHSDFGGYWYADEASYNSNPVRPDIFHNLLAFEIGGVTYSTAVDDSVLTNEWVSFLPWSYQAFAPTSAIASLVGQAAFQDGDLSAVVQEFPTPGDDVTPYITEWIQGLGLGSFANNVGWTFEFMVSNLWTSVIGDLQPDIIYFNWAIAWSDEIVFRFEDVWWNQLWEQVTAVEDRPNLWKIVNDRMNIQTGAATALNRSQPLEGFWFDLSEFDLTTAELALVNSLSMQLSSKADPTFIAYNTAALVVSACWNGIVEEEEECDDGNDDETDECSSSCEIIECDEWSERINRVCTPCGMEWQVVCDDGCDEWLVDDWWICAACGSEGEPECSDWCDEWLIQQWWVCVLCWSEGEPLCTDGCDEWLIDQWWICTACWDLWQPTCDIWCMPWLVDQWWICVMCGEDGQPECNEGCEEWTVSIDGVCTTCGSLDEPVCQFNACDSSWLAWVEGICVACGSLDEPVCQFNACDSLWLVWVEEICVACGSLDEPVCEGNTCESWLVWSAWFCVPCGALGERVCEDANACEDADGMCNGFGCEDAMIDSEGWCRAHVDSVNKSKVDVRSKQDDDEDEEEYEMPLVYIWIQMEGEVSCAWRFEWQITINDDNFEGDLESVRIMFDGPTRKVIIPRVRDDGSFSFAFDPYFVDDGDYTIFYNAKHRLHPSDWGSFKVEVDCSWYVQEPEFEEEIQDDPVQEEVVQEENNQNTSEQEPSKEQETFPKVAKSEPVAEKIEAEVDLFDSAPVVETAPENLPEEPESYQIVNIQESEEVEELELETEAVWKVEAEPEVIDTDPDGDGLENFDEYRFGSDINNSDTDGDGLNDFEEVRVHNTDPLNSDTDGGGVQDGVEISQGNNPLDRKDDIYDNAAAILDIELKQQLQNQFFNSATDPVDAQYDRLPPRIPLTGAWVHN